MSRILWYEDLSETMERDKNMVESLGFKIDIVGTPNEVLDKLENSEEKYDLIILDIMDPEAKKIMINNRIYQTNAGFETGLVLYDEFLKKLQIPTIFYTARLINDDLRNKYKDDNNVVLIEKKELEPRLIPTIKKFLDTGKLKNK